MLTNPTSIIGDEKGWVVGISCVEMELGEPDESGRRSPIEKAGSDFEIPCDVVIMALGTSPNPLLKMTTEGLETNRKGCLVADEKGATTREGIFAGGDAVTGAATVILAMGAGRKAAKSIDEYIRQKSIKRLQDMRKFCFAAFAAVLIGTTACTPKAPEQFTGKIVDGTMNTVTVESPADGRRGDFHHGGCRYAGGLRPAAGQYGDRYLPGKLGETTPALKVVTDPAYVTAIGRWVEPNPIDPEQEQGIEIRINGVAASINMLTLRYEVLGIGARRRSNYPERRIGRKRRAVSFRADGRNYRDGRQAGPQNRCGRSDQKDLI